MKKFLFIFKILGFILELILGVVSGILLFKKGRKQGIDECMNNFKSHDWKMIVDNDEVVRIDSFDHDEYVILTEDCDDYEPLVRKENLNAAN